MIMGKTLTKTVVVDGVVYPAGSDLPDGVTVENERAFEPSDLPTPLEQIEADEEAADKRREDAEAAAEESAKAEESEPAPAKPAARPAARKG
jgi:hypothetical protein